FEDTAYASGLWLQQIFEAIQSIDNNEFIEKGLTGKKLGEAIDQRRHEVISNLKDSHEPKR
ncbi:MAG: hypothetical protein KBT53_06455, partial [Porticoccus sp.]|nr:hypothetical protein [Porticoccus sp.]MBQ0808455.1 hypothetical protein [Porticoccus sp.]